MKVKINKHNRGYAPMHQTVYPGNMPDLKESFNVGTGLTAADPDVIAGKPLHGVNRWPELAGFRAAVEAYFDAVTALGRRLLGPLAFCLDSIRTAGAIPQADRLHAAVSLPADSRRRAT